MAKVQAETDRPELRMGPDEAPEWLQEVMRQMFKLPLPPGWSEEVGYKGQSYFFHKPTGDTSSSHPQLALFKAIVQEALSWPDGSREEVAKCCQEQMERAHAQALKELSEWSGPYCMEAGLRPDRSLHSVDFRDLYYYNENTGESSWVDPRTSLQFELQQRRQLIYLCLALYQPKVPSDAPEEQTSGTCLASDAKTPTPQIQVIAPDSRAPTLTLPVPRRGNLQCLSPETSPTRHVRPDDSCRSHASYYSATSTSDEVMMPSNDLSAAPAAVSAC